MVAVTDDVEPEIASSWEDTRKVDASASAAQAVMIPGNTDRPAYFGRAGSQRQRRGGRRGGDSSGFGGPGQDGCDGGKADSCASRLERRNRLWWWGAAARRRLQQLGQLWRVRQRWSIGKEWLGGRTS